MDNPIGKFVNYVITNGEVRPMLVVVAFEKGDAFMVNGVQFRDGSNDDRKDNAGGIYRGKLNVWRPSVAYDAQKHPGTWH